MTKKLVPIIGVATLFIALVAMTGCMDSNKLSKCCPSCNCDEIKEKTSVITVFNEGMWEYVQADGITYTWLNDGSIHASPFGKYNGHNVTFQYRCHSDGWMEIIKVTADHSVCNNCGCACQSTCTCNYQPRDCSNVKCGGCGC